MASADGGLGVVSVGAWEVRLGAEWRPLEGEALAKCEELSRKGEPRGVVLIGGQSYEYDIVALTQTNTASGKARPIRRSPQVAVASAAGAATAATARAVEAGSAGSGSAAGAGAAAVSAATVPPLPPPAASTKPGKRAEVWLAGDWKPLGARESEAIVLRSAAGAQVFRFKVDRFEYEVDLARMTQTNLATGRTRTIRLVDALASLDPRLGFDAFRHCFRERSGAAQALTETMLLQFWGVEGSGKAAPLAAETVRSALAEMDLRKNAKIDMVQWNHFWALERDSCSFHAGKEVNEKLIEALREDAQVLGRMQMHFETAVGEEAAAATTEGAEGLSSAGLLRACERLVASPKNVIEKKWAKEVLDKHKAGEGIDDDSCLSYYDFLNVMLGRKKFSVYLWMYDISNGYAEQWSWLLLGQTFEGVWHTGVVVEWPDGSAEFWFGGRLFHSVPGTTPFGTPRQKRFLGSTYKLKEEVWDHMRRHLAGEFTRENYDVLTHNCNHFSDKLVMFLLNEHIPDEVLYQPNLVMSKPLVRMIRPALNHWLGGFDSLDGRATDGGEAAQRMWEADVRPGAVIEFSKCQLGRPMVGEVVEASVDDCTVCCLDLWSASVTHRTVPSALVTRVLRPGPPAAEGTCAAPAKSPATREAETTAACPGLSYARSLCGVIK